MYISANLPPLYGRFNQIKEENYPFKHSFVSYLETISRLGLSKDMDIDKLVGFIENTLLKDNRLPDIPRGDMAVKFRFTTENPTIIKYFDGNTVSNKTAILLVIRMTLRLSEIFGTSLFRITELIEQLNETEDEEELPIKITKKRVSHSVATPVEVVEEIKEATPKVQAPVKEQVQAPVDIQVQAPVKEQVQAPVNETAPEKASTTESDEGTDMVSRLNSLIERSEELLSDDSSDDNDGDVAVATNPLLSDFF